MTEKNISRLKISLSFLSIFIAAACTSTNNFDLHGTAVKSKIYSSVEEEPFFSQNCNSFFEENGFNVDNIPPIDEYFRQWSGIADGQEMRKYACQSDDGLILIIKLALNEIF